MPRKKPKKPKDHHIGQPTNPYPLGSETMETFPFNIDLRFSKNVTEEEVGIKTLITPFESGKEQRRAAGASRKRYTKQFSKLMADGNTAWEFFQARQGAYDAFYLNIVDKDGATTQKTVRFDTDTMSREMIFGVLNTFTLSFIEVI